MHISSQVQIATVMMLTYFFSIKMRVDLKAELLMFCTKRLNFFKFKYKSKFYRINLNAQSICIEIKAEKKLLARHKEWSFPIRIILVNVNRSPENYATNTPRIFHIETTLNYSFRRAIRVVCLYADIFKFTKGILNAKLLCIRLQWWTFKVLLTL